jgi:hypothetical protein
MADMPLPIAGQSESRSAVRHIEAAAYAALLALERSQAGVYNIARDDAEVNSAKAKRELGWSPDMRSETHV